MRLFKKIALIFGILVFLFLVSLGGTALYLYHHPSRVKGFIEKSVSRFSGISCAIQDLSWSFHPLRLQAEGIKLRPLQDKQDFQVEIPGLRADMAMEGTFGRKSLVV
jgi:hypothetical protein